MQAYVSGALHSVSNLEKARAFYLSLAKVCEESGLLPYVPHQYTDPVFHQKLSHDSVFERDYNALRASDIVIAYIGQPSLGVGAEIAIAFERRIPVIAVYQDGENPSRFILGMLNNSEICQTIRYKDEEDCKVLLRNALVMSKIDSTLQANK